MANDRGKHASGGDESSYYSVLAVARAARLDLRELLHHLRFSTVLVRLNDDELNAADDWVDDPSNDGMLGRPASEYRSSFPTDIIRARYGTMACLDSNYLVFFGEETSWLAKVEFTLPKSERAPFPVNRWTKSRIVRRKDLYLEREVVTRLGLPTAVRLELEEETAKGGAARADAASSTMVDPPATQDERFPARIIRARLLNGVHAAPATGEVLAAEGSDAVADAPRLIMTKTVVLQRRSRGGQRGRKPATEAEYDRAMTLADDLNGSALEAVPKGLSEFARAVCEHAKSLGKPLRFSAKNLEKVLRARINERRSKSKMPTPTEH